MALDIKAPRIRSPILALNAVYYLAYGCRIRGNKAMDIAIANQNNLVATHRGFLRSYHLELEDAKKIHPSLYDFFRSEFEYTHIPNMCG